MVTLSERAKGWFRKVLCTSLPAAVTESTKTELALQYEYGTLNLDVTYRSRAYRAFGMDHYIVTIKIDTGSNNVRKIRNAGLDEDDIFGIHDYHFEGIYKGSRHYHLSRYASSITKTNVL